MQKRQKIEDESSSGKTVSLQAGLNRGLTIHVGERFQNE